MKLCILGSRTDSMFSIPKYLFIRLTPLVNKVIHYRRKYRPQ